MNPLVGFGLKQTIKGALIVGILAGIMTGGQGLAYAITYPSTADRAHFAASLQNAPGLGVLYGESKNLLSPAGYMVYRTVPFLGLIVSVWALMVTARLLRGQEENGQLELISASPTTTRQASTLLTAGYSISFIVAFVISVAITTAMSITKEVAGTFTSSLLTMLAIFLPALVFAGVSVFVSQLSTTRRRALFYGFGLLLVCFILRAVGNTINDFYWLKNLTPFGWADLLNPIISLQVQWFWPFLLALLIGGFGLYFSAKRDLGTGLLKESATARSRFLLLGSPWQFTWRQHSVVFISWAMAAIFISILMAALTTVAVQTLQDSASLTVIVSQLGGSVNDLKVAFLSSGLLLVVIILLILVAASIGTIRAIEAKGQLDTLLTQPLHRARWLASHWISIIVALFITALLAAAATGVVASSQSISLDSMRLFTVGLTLTGTALFLLGSGILLYSLWPRIASGAMYGVIIWSFFIDILSSLIKDLPDFVTHSSLFHYATFSLSKTPDYQTFWWLLGLGVGLGLVGIYCFTQRDLVAE